MKKYNTYNERWQIIKLSNCRTCGMEISHQKTFCPQCFSNKRKYKPEDYQKRKHKILEVFTPVDN